MKKIEKKYFNDPDVYGRAMVLVAQYEVIEREDWDTAEEFLMAVEEDGDMELLRLGLKQKGEDSSIYKVKYELLLEQVENHHPITNVTSTKNNLLLSDLVEKWISEKKKILKPSSLESAKNHIHIFCKIIEEINNGSCRIGDLTSEKIRKFNDILSRLPVSRNSTVV